MNIEITKESPNYDDYVKVLAKEIETKYQDVYDHIYKKGMDHGYSHAVSEEIRLSSMESLPEDELPW